MTALGTKTICIALIAGLLLTACPVPAVAEISDSSSEGAAITVGLFVTVVVVLFIVGLKADVDNVFGHQGLPSALARSGWQESADRQAATETPPAVGLRLTF